MIDEKVIIGCKKGDKTYIKALYVEYAPIFKNICIRYTGNSVEAEDLMHEGFVKIITNINQFKGHGSFEGWLKRIIINTAITYVKNKKKFFYEEIDNIKDIDDEEIGEVANAKDIIMQSDFSREDILHAVNEMPDGFKMVFNLYAVEGFSHKEIAETLNISVNTSKSQLSRARKYLQKILLQLSNIKEMQESNK